jgi:hypothetical protein
MSFKYQSGEFSSPDSIIGLPHREMRKKKGGKKETNMGSNRMLHLLVAVAISVLLLGSLLACDIFGEYEEMFYTYTVCDARVKVSNPKFPDNPYTNYSYVKKDVRACFDVTPWEDNGIHQIQECFNCKEVTERILRKK